MSGNHYDTLGVPFGCDIAVVKASYRRLAMQYHPDRNPGNKRAEEQFKRISHAYDEIKKGNSGQQTYQRSQNHSQQGQRYYTRPIHEFVTVRVRMDQNDYEFANSVTFNGISYPLTAGLRSGDTIALSPWLTASIVTDNIWQGAFRKYFRKGDDLYVKYAVGSRRDLRRRKIVHLMDHPTRRKIEFELNLNIRDGKVWKVANGGLSMSPVRRTRHKERGDLFVTFTVPRRREIDVLLEAMPFLYWRPVQKWYPYLLPPVGITVLGWLAHYFV